MNKNNFVNVCLSLFKKLPEDIISSDGDFCINFDYGVVYPEVLPIYRDDVSQAFNANVGLMRDMNKTFYDANDTVISYTQDELYRNACMHYFTTYGADFLGLGYDKEFVFVPDKAFRQEGIEEPVDKDLTKFKILQTISKDEIVRQVKERFANGVALTYYDIEKYFALIKHYGISINLEDITNKEAKVYYCCVAKVLPETADELVRMINYLFTGNTILVKDEETIRKWNHQNWFTSEEKQELAEELIIENPKLLSTVYYRYKHLFMAARHRNKQLAKTVNYIARQAKKNWQPRKDFEYITTRILKGETFSNKFFENMSTYDLVKIYDKLNFILTYPEQDFFVIRNGKFFVKDTNRIKELSEVEVKQALDQILDTLRERYSNVVVDLPDNITLAMPTSGKAYVGGIPAYSFSKMKNASVIGVSWDDKEFVDKDGKTSLQRVDIDLSLITEEGKKYGWNGSYYDQNADIIFSGDMTCAGAETFYLNTQHDCLINLNLYNVDSHECFFFASAEDKDFWKHSSKKQMFEHNNVILKEKLTFDKRSNMVGLYSGEDNTIAYVNIVDGDSSVSYPTKYTAPLIKALKLKTQTALKFSDIFKSSKDFLEDELDKESYKYYDLTEDYTVNNCSDVIESYLQNEE